MLLAFNYLLGIFHFPRFHMHEKQRFFVFQNTFSSLCRRFCAFTKKQGKVPRTTPFTLKKLTTSQLKRLFPYG